MNDIAEQGFVSQNITSETDSEPHRIPVLGEGEELLEMSDDFNLEEFQVVRREFFAHIREPAVTFNNRKFYVNSACLSKFPNTDYVQALINPHTKILALRPCRENERGSFQWCSLGHGKRKPKQTTCTLFFLKMFGVKYELKVRFDWLNHFLLRYFTIEKLCKRSFQFIYFTREEYLIAYRLIVQPIIRPEREITLAPQIVPIILV